MSHTHLLRLADQGSLKRGRQYAAAGRVSVVGVRGGVVIGEAEGERSYDLSIDDHGGRCSCPMGQRDVFCKHLVALAIVADGGGGSAAPAAARRTPRPPVASIDEAPQLIDSLKVRGHLDYHRANAHGEDAHRTVDLLETVLEPSTADALLPLLEKGAAHLHRAILRSDDSSGIQFQALGRLLDLHEKAAELGDPDPVRLGRWLAKSALDSDEIVRVDVAAYAEALGDRGLAAVRRVVDKRLAEQPGDHSARQVAKRLALMSGDVATVVEVVGDGLGTAWHHVELVSALRELRADDEALDHALRGARAFPDSPISTPLFDTAVELLRRRGRLEEAVELREEQLAARADLGAFGALRHVAVEAGCWDEVRLRALDVLLERDQVTWLRALLHDREDELAWEASLTMDLPAPLRLTLVRARARTHPVEVVEPYVALIRRTLTPTDQQAYREGCALLGELRRVAVEVGRPDVHDDLVAELLDQHKRRPTLVAMLQRAPRA